MRAAGRPRPVLVGEEEEQLVLPARLADRTADRYPRSCCLLIDGAASPFFTLAQVFPFCQFHWLLR